MAWNTDLDAGSPAHNIASSTHARIKVLAGPGAGKSFAMKRRVARLLEVDKSEPTKILAVTFTRVAADDLHRELVSLKVPGAGSLHGSTLHSLAMSILMRNHVLEVLGRIPRPLNDFELEPLLADLEKTHGNKHERKRLIRAYGAAWARLQTQEPGYAPTPNDQAFADDLVAWLAFHQAMLMDEVIPHLLQYLQMNPGAAELAEYEHVLVDEYQDLNRAEQETIELLGSNSSICIIGDDDQSIYSFRHAHPQGIRLWAAPKPTDHHAIDECRRCPTTVVRMAKALISRNLDRLGLALQERAANGLGEVIVRQYSTADAEADAVATKIDNLIKLGVSPGEIIVLAQRRTFATPIFQRLQKQGIPTKSYYAETALDSEIAQERFSILKLHLNPEDRVALRWLVGRGHSDWYCKQYRRLLAYCKASGDSPWQALVALSAGTISVNFTDGLKTRFAEIKAELDILAAKPTLPEFIDHWLPAGMEVDMLRDTVAFCAKNTETPSQLYASLYEAITQPEVPLELKEVRVMSLHKSKGLSAPFVFIVGCVEGLLPPQPDLSLTPDERRAKLEEDRRLFYVGITRTKSDASSGRVGYLGLSFSQTMLAADAYKSQIKPVAISGKTAVLQPSRFLAEMKPHLPKPLHNQPL